MVWSTMSANGSLTATGVLLWCPPQRTLDKAFSWKAQRIPYHRENVAEFSFGSTRAKNSATPLEGGYRGGGEVRIVKSPPLACPDHACGELVEPPKGLAVSAL
jgi:hypothetical protein